jgi:hypothetical protein
MGTRLNSLASRVLQVRLVKEKKIEFDLSLKLF